MMQYKGYTGVVTVDPEAGLIHGSVANLRAVVTFQGESVKEAEQAFRDSVDDYLDFCREKGIEPEKPYSGKFLGRISPQLHRSLATEAASQSLSLNEFVGQALARLTSPPAARISARGRSSDESGGSRPRKIGKNATAG